MHDEWSTSRTDDTKENAAVSDHLPSILLQAYENKFIGALLHREQLVMEELPEAPAILSISDIEDGQRIRLKPVGLPKSNNDLIDDREGIATRSLALHDEVILLLGDDLGESMHLLPQNEYWVTEDEVYCVNRAVIHEMSRQRPLPEEVIVIEKGLRIIHHAIVVCIEVAPGVALIRYLSL